jgi:hypothetical protein
MTTPELVSNKQARRKQRLAAILETISKKSSEQFYATTKTQH